MLHILQKIELTIPDGPGASSFASATLDRTRPVFTATPLQQSCGKTSNPCFLRAMKVPQKDIN